MLAAQVEAQVRKQLPRGKDTNWVPPKFAEGEKAVIFTTQLNDPPGQPTLLTPDDMVLELLCGVIPPGVTVTNETFNGVAAPGPYPAARAGGIFTGGGVLFNPPHPPFEGPIGIPQGVILSSGNIVSVRGGPFGACNSADWTSTVNGQPADPNLNAIVAPKVTFDRAALEFDITTTVPRVLGFRFVFGSEEYNEWVYTAYEDSCAIIITGPGGLFQNLALVPPGGGGPAFVPVTIDNVNHDNPYGGPGWRNWRHYVNNDCGDGVLPAVCGPPERETELDGLTEDNRTDLIPRVFRSQAFLMNPGITYHLKLVVADTSDNVYDSDLFVKGTARGGYCCVCGTPPCFCIDGASQEECQDLGGSWGEGLMCGEGPCGSTGACCLPDDSCANGYSIQACHTAGGEYMGDGTVCGAAKACCFADETCQELDPFCCSVVGGTAKDGTCSGTDCTVYGACCTQGDECTLVASQSACTAMSGTYQGDGTACPAACYAEDHNIPAVSEWGMVVLVILVLAAGTVVIRRARALKAHA
jgi:hypothetical protein